MPVRAGYRNQQHGRPFSMIPCAPETFVPLSAVNTGSRQKTSFNKTPRCLEDFLANSDTSGTFNRHVVLILML